LKLSDSAFAQEEDLFEYICKLNIIQMTCWHWDL